MLRHLVIARISQPSSKLATVAYLRSYYKEDVDLSRIYRYMDKLYNCQMELVQEISIAHTRRILGGNIGLLFYDVTTLYFEAAPKDDMRQAGFSKDGKTSEAQIVLGLLVSQDGYPLSYSIFNGSQYEGYTMTPIVDDFVQRFSLKDFVIVADSGLMSAKNMKLLRSAGYKYIVGARIKTERTEVRDWILSLEKKNGAVYEHQKDDGDRLVVSYSAGPPMMPRTGTREWQDWRRHTVLAGLLRTRLTNVATTSSLKSARTCRSLSVKRRSRKT